jgi:hypothetical protein
MSYRRFFEWRPAERIYDKVFILSYFRVFVWHKAEQTKNKTKQKTWDKSATILFMIGVQAAELFS